MHAVTDIDIDGMGTAVGSAAAGARLEVWAVHLSFSLKKNRLQTKAEELKAVLPSGLIRAKIYLISTHPPKRMLKMLCFL